MKRWKLAVCATIACAVAAAAGVAVRAAGPTQLAGVFPPIIPRVFHNPDPSGVVETYNPAGPTDTARHPFFQSLGTNGRACASCHEPRSAWGVSAASIQRRFETSNGTDPIFRPVDGATCPSDDVSSLAAKRTAYRLLLSKGLIRIGLTLPDNQIDTNPPVPRDYDITVVSDPYSCTDLGASPPALSIYRRPLISANLRFLTECPPGEASCTPLTIMWDGREPSLASQATDAILGHEQAAHPPSAAQLAQIVSFESQLCDAQIHDNSAGYLDAHGATGGPVTLAQQEFYIGINDVFGGDPLGLAFTPDVFTLYDGWENIAIDDGRDAARQAIARGEEIFNRKQFTITGVNGLNRFDFDPMGANPIIGTCATCHDSPNVGNHSLPLPVDIGVSDVNPPALDVSGLPVFEVACTDTSGPLQGVVFQVTDPARALITGHCADVGKVKGPMLRGLAGRAPYFHNGAAAKLEDVVNFYDQRFSIGLSDQEKADLVAFLRTL